MVRAVIVQLWAGSRVVHRLGFTPADVDSMTDNDVTRRLRLLGVSPLPATELERAARLKEWPTPADLDAIATAWLPWNDGVRPVVRVIEQMPSRQALGVGGAGGPAGSLPRGLR